MRHLGTAAIRPALGDISALSRHDPARAGLIVGIFAGGLTGIGLWGLYGDLWLSNLVVVGVAEALAATHLLVIAVLVGRLVRSQDRWQVESALTLRQLVSQGKDASGSIQAGSPFYARQLERRVQSGIDRSKEYGTKLSLVALRLEVPGQAPTHAVFTKANVEVADFATLHRDAILAPTALGLFEYAFYLPNCDRRIAEAMAAFIANALDGYRCVFGIAVFPEDGEDAASLLRCATEAAGMLLSNAA